MEDCMPENSRHRARAEMAIKALYRGAGFTQPAQITWFGSPFAMLDAAISKTAGPNIKTYICQAWQEASRREIAPVPQNPLLSLFRSLADAGPALPVLQQLSRNGASNVGDICVYRNDARLVDFFNLFVRDSLGLREHGLLRCAQAPAENLEFILPQEHACYASDPPVRLHADSGGRLHCPDGPAAIYSDGWKVYALEGFWMPGYMIEHAKQLAMKRA